MNPVVIQGLQVASRVIVTTGVAFIAHRVYKIERMMKRQHESNQVPVQSADAPATAAPAAEPEVAEPIIVTPPFSNNPTEPTPSA